MATRDGKAAQATKKELARDRPQEKATKDAKPYPDKK